MYSGWCFFVVSVWVFCCSFDYVFVCFDNQKKDTDSERFIREGIGEKLKWRIKEILVGSQAKTWRKKEKKSNSHGLKED